MPRGVARPVIILLGVVVCALYAFWHLGTDSTTSKLSFELLKSSEQSLLAEIPRTDIQVRTPESPFLITNETSALAGTFTHVIAPGETLSGIWEQFGAPHTGSLNAAKAFQKAGHDIKSLRSGDKIVVVKHSGDIVRLEKKLGGGATLVLNGNSTDGYFVDVEQEEIIESERTVNGTIFNSFSASAEDLALSYNLVDDFVDLFSNRIEFRKDFQPGDTFSVIFTEKRTARGETVGFGTIKAASVQLGGKFYAAVSDLGPDGVVRYFDENGQMPGNYFLRYPLQFTRISSVFTTARFHPVLNITRPHNGVDFAAPTGTPVRSVAGGVVISAGYSSSTGNMVRIQHDDRFTTEYMHLSKITKGIKVGTKLTRGQLIGAVGMTGLATGPHLHFGLFDRGQYVDPLKSKLPSVEPGVGPSKMVLATLELLKKNHTLTAVASAEQRKKA